MQTEFLGACATLASGTYLYTALVHLHRSSANLSRTRTAASFFGVPTVSVFSPWMGRNTGHLSRSYFWGTVSPEDILRRHTLFGFFHLSYDKVESLEREQSLVLGNYSEGKHTSLDAVISGGALNLRWCERCANEDLEKHGFASWKVIHQISGVRICHVHGDRLISRCRACGFRPGRLGSFRFPGETCPNCSSFDFEEDPITVRPAYLDFVRDIAHAFESQVDIFRSSVWASLISKFTSQFSSVRDAEGEVVRYLCRQWELNTPDEIWSSIDVKPSKLGVFEKSYQSLCMRILIYPAIKSLCPKLFKERLQLASAVEDSSFQSTVMRHAHLLNIGRRVTQALVLPLNLREAATAAAVPYGQTYQAWKKILQSMLAEFGEDRVRSMLPKERRFNKVLRVGSGQDLLIAYKRRVSTLIDEKPNLNRSDLWREHYRAMRYLSRNDYDWLAGVIGGNVSSKRPKSQ